MLENHMVIGDYYDDTAPEEYARECQGCGEPFHEDDLVEWGAQWRCEMCRAYCPICRDVEVLDDLEFCETCAAWAMGAEV